MMPLKDYFSEFPSKEVEERGWILHWTGFKGTWDSLNLCGQWVAWEKKGAVSERMYVSCVPGKVDRYQEGYMIDCSIPVDQSPLCAATLWRREHRGMDPLAWLEALISNGRKRLIEFMEKDGAFSAVSAKNVVLDEAASFDEATWKRMGYPPFSSQPETRNLTYEMLEKSYNAAVVGEEHPKAAWKDGTFYFYNKHTNKTSAVQTWCHVCGRSPDKCVCARAGLDSADTLTLPRFMKCPVCGTNPGRCEKPLTSEDKVCFSCGRELEEL